MPRTTVADIEARPFQHVEFEPLPPAPGETNRPLIPLKTAGDAPAVYLVHGGYGQVFQFKRLAERFRADIPLYGLEARGLRDGGEPHASVPEFAASYIAAIRARQPSGPYLIAGFSFGGWVAWEMARQLDAAGEDVRLLMLDVGLFSTDGPRAGRLRRMWDQADFHWQNWRGVHGRVRKAYQREALKTEMMRLNGFLGLDRTAFLYRLAMKLGTEEPEAQLRLFRASLRAMDGWELPPYPRPLTLFRAELQPPSANNNERMNITPELAPGGIDVRHVPGSHSFMFQPPHVNKLALEMEAWVDRQVAASEASEASAEDAELDERDIAG